MQLALICGSVSESVTSASVSVTVRDNTRSASASHVSSFSSTTNPLLQLMNARRADSDVSGDEDAYDSRKSILEPAIGSVVEALGGLESGVYRLGDECYGCLKDLKKYWRKDDTDDERTVARIFWKTRVLPNDLIPILLATAGNGDFEDKRAIACVDLMTAMTWPIDMAEELQELDEVEDKGTDYTELLSSHLAYKATLLKPDVMKALFGIVLSCLAKTSKERTERDVQIVQVVLYLLRNLAFIKDLPTNMYLSSDQAEYSSLQSRFIKLLNETQIFELLLTTASSSLDEPIFNASNTLVLDIFYLLFRGVKPAILADNQEKVCVSPIIRTTRSDVPLSNLLGTCNACWQLRTNANKPSPATRLHGILVSVPLSSSP